jgi:hypothetical protein
VAGGGDFQNNFRIFASKLRELWKNHHLSGRTRDDETESGGGMLTLFQTRDPERPARLMYVKDTKRPLRPGHGAASRLGHAAAVDGKAKYLSPRYTTRIEELMIAVITGRHLEGAVI